MRMGRPRKARKDLPPGLYWTDRRGFYFYRVRGEETTYKGFGKVEREAAIREWVKITGTPAEIAVDGTVAEIIDDFVSQEIPRLERAKRPNGKPKLSPATAKEYRRQAPLLRGEFGEKRYARTQAQSMNPDVLRLADVQRFVRRFDGQKGSVSANRMVACLSAIFTFAMRNGYCTYNPCLGVERNDEAPRDRPVTQEDRDAIGMAACVTYRLMMRLTEATGMRLTDVRNLLIGKCGDSEIDLRQSKTGRGQTWEITPAVRALLDEAKALPGRSRSLFVFPNPRTGKAYSEGGVHYMRRAALEAAGLSNLQHRDLRKAAVNEAKAAGMNATEFAGHTDERTTAKHYVNAPTKVKPIR